MKIKLSVVALLCCAQLWMGCAAKNPEESDIRGASTAAVSPACDVTAAVDEPRAYRIPIAYASQRRNEPAIRIEPADVDVAQMQVIDRHVATHVHSRALRLEFAARDCHE